MLFSAVPASEEAVAVAFAAAVGPPALELERLAALALLEAPAEVGASCASVAELHHDHVFGEEAGPLPLHPLPPEPLLLEEPVPGWGLADVLHLRGLRHAWEVAGVRPPDALGEAKGAAPLRRRLEAPPA